MTLSLNLRACVCALPLLLLPTLSTAKAQASAAASFTPVHFVQENLASSATHLLVGHSMAIDSAHRLSRVYVTNPSVLDTFTSGPHQVLVTSKQAGVSTLVVWDESGSYKSYLISSDINVEALQTAIRQAMPRETIAVSSAESCVTLSGSVSTAAVSDMAFRLAGLYSKVVTNALVVNSASVQQVRLKVRIVEIDRTKLEQFGFNFFSAGGNNLVATTTTQFPSSITASNAGSGSQSSAGTSTGNKSVSVVNALNFLLYSSKLNIGATIQDLESRDLLQILAEPNISAVSGEKASFLAGGEFPFPVVQSSAGTLASITVQFRPYGVRLDFTPIVNADNTVQLTVAPEVSALDYTNAVQISGYTIPALSTRRAETQVVLRNGQTFAISGLLDQRTTDQFSRTPGIAATPILGKLFTSKNRNHSTTELIVLVTPEIIAPLDGDVGTPEIPRLAQPLMNTQTFDSQLPPSRPKRQK